MPTKGRKHQPMPLHWQRTQGPEEQRENWRKGNPENGTSSKKEKSSLVSLDEKSGH